jgi:hypothetical protein
MRESDAVQHALDNERPKESNERDTPIKKTLFNNQAMHSATAKVLPVQRREYLETRKGIIESCIRDTLKPYAQAICQNFSRKVLSKLPRELRDVVYECLVTPDYVYVGTEYFTNTGLPCEHDRDAHFWSSDYVGDVMKADLVQTWYRTSLFYLWNRAKNYEVISRFLTSDRWGVGLKPHEHIARVRFDLGDSLIHQPGVRIHYPGGQMQESCLDSRYTAALTAPLKTFLAYGFPDRAHFLIRIHTLGSLETSCLSGELLRETLEAIVADLAKLRAAGQRWTVQWSELPDLEFTSSQRDLTAEGWKTSIEKKRLGMHP